MSHGGISETEQLRYQAEDVVRSQLTRGPAFDREVKRVMRELKALGQTVAKPAAKPVQRRKRAAPRQSFL